MRNFFDELKNHKTAAQLYRFGIVGIASNLFGYALYLLMTYFGTPPKLTVSILYPIGAVIAFLSNKNWVFLHQGQFILAGTRYFFVQLVGYLINILVLIVMVDKLSYPHQLAQLLAIGVVAIFLFITFKFFIFKKPVLTGREM